jgi:hypothetical protein
LKEFSYHATVFADVLKVAALRDKLVCQRQGGPWRQWLKFGTLICK